MDMYDRRRLIGRIAMLALTLIIIAGVVLLVIFNRDLDASSLKVLSTEGVVIIEDKNGNASFYGGDRTLPSGTAVSTGVDGHASIAVDNYKTVTLESSSRVQFTKADGAVTVDLTNGGIFFEVNSPLSGGESVTLKTGSYIISIGQSSGYLHTEENGTIHMTLTTGTAHFASEQSVFDVQAGQKVTVEGSSFDVETAYETDLNEFALHYLLDRWELRDAICRQTGWDNNTLIILGGGEIEPDPTETSETDETSETSETESATPTPRPTSTPRPTPTPVPVIYYDPAPVEPEPIEPAPEETAAPEETTPAETAAPEQTEAPAPEQTEAPAPEETEAPAPEQTEAPAPEQTEAPAPEQTEAPADNPEPQEQPADQGEAA